MQKLSTAYKAIASPVHCPLCGAYPKESITTMEPNRVFRCLHCEKDYVVKPSLEEKTISQIMTAILQDFSGIVTDEIKNNLSQMITFYHQNLVNEMEKTLQNQKNVTIAAIQETYSAVDQRMLMILENIQTMKQDLKIDLKQLGKQQENLMNKNQEQYQVLLQQTQLIVNLIRQIDSSNVQKKDSQLAEEKPKRKLKHTDFNPEEFAPI